VHRAVMFAIAQISCGLSSTNECYVSRIAIQHVLVLSTSVIRRLHRRFHGIWEIADHVAGVYRLPIFSHWPSTPQSR